MGARLVSLFCFLPHGVARFSQQKYRVSSHMRISQSRDLKFTLTWAGAFVCSPAPSAFHRQTRPSWWAVWVAQATSRAQAPGHTVGLHSPVQGRPSTMTGTASALSPNRFSGLLTLTRKTEWNPHGTREPGAQEAEGVRRGRACETPEISLGSRREAVFFVVDFS